MRALAVLALLAGCAAVPPAEQPGNERALNATYRGNWPVACRDLRAPADDPAVLQFMMQDRTHIAALKFDRGAGPRYENYALPESAYGPFHGEVVIDSGSPYAGANDYKINDQLRLFLPSFEAGWEKSRLARDRDSDLQNAAMEVATEGQHYDSIVHLRCWQR